MGAALRQTEPGNLADSRSRPRRGYVSPGADYVTFIFSAGWWVRHSCFERPMTAPGTVSACMTLEAASCVALSVFRVSENLRMVPNDPGLG